MGIEISFRFVNLLNTGAINFMLVILNSQFPPRMDIYNAM